MKSFPIILISFGVGFLLYNLQVISFTPWQIVGRASLFGSHPASWVKSRNVNGAARTPGKLPSG